MNFRDVADSREANAKMLDSQNEAEKHLALLETLFRNAPVGFAFVDRAFRFVRVNDVLAASHSIPAAAHIGKTVQEVVPQLWPTLEPLFHRALAGETVLNQDVSGFSNAGQPRYWLVNFYPVHLEEVIGVGVIVNDITDRRQAEEARHATEARYSTLFEYAPAGIVIADTESYYLDANAKMCRMLGYTREELIGLHASDIVAETEIQHIGPALSMIKANTDYCREWQFRRKDGSVFEAEVSSTLMPDGNLLGIVRDITERKQAELRIRRLNRVYAVLSDINQTIVREKNPQTMLETACRIAVEKGQLLMAWIGLANGASGRIKVAAHAGATADTLEILNELLGNEQRQCECAFTLHALQTGRHGVCNDIERDPQSASWRDAGLQRGYRSMASLPLTAAERVIGTFNLYADKPDFFDADELRLLDELAMDIGFALELHDRETERRQLEEQFRQAQKMEAFGQLAGGVAHDFNNLLTVINGWCHLLLLQLRPDDPIRRSLLEIQKAGEGAGMLTQQLLAFSRQQVLEPKVLNLNAVVSDIEKMLRRLIGADIVFTTTRSPALETVKADPGQLQQILINLAVNARDAMPKGGRLSMETKNAVLDESYCRACPDLQPGEYVLLSVSDTGCGMDEATKARIFEPFFTTKGVGKGTGLGLATVHGIVKQSRGHIEVHSEVGRGTTFKVYLPKASESQTKPDTQTFSQEMPAGTETVLLVEDEDAVRALGGHILRACGYTVLEAANGKEAVKRSAAHPEPIHLLVSDVVVPYLGGRELAELIISMRPECKVLFVSGYMDDAVIRHGVLKAGYAFLQKPFTPLSLAQKVRSVLNGFSDGM